MNNSLFNYDYEALCVEEFFNKSSLEFGYERYHDRTFTLNVEGEILDEKFFRGLSWFTLLINFGIEDAKSEEQETVSGVKQRILYMLEKICNEPFYFKTLEILYYDLYANSFAHGRERAGNMIFISKCDIETLSNKPPVLGFNEEESRNLIDVLVHNKIVGVNNYSNPKLLISIHQLYAEDTNINDLYIESHSKYLSISFDVVTFINTSGTVVLNIDYPDNKKIVYEYLRLDYSELNVVDLNASSTLGLCRYELSLLPTVPVLRRCASYYQEPDDVSHVKLVSRNIKNKIKHLDWLSRNTWCGHEVSEESLRKRNELLQEYASRMNRHMTGGIIICRDKETFEKLVGLKCKVLKDIYIIDVKLSTDVGIEGSILSSHRFQFTASTINYIDNVGLLSLTRSSIDDNKEIPDLYVLDMYVSTAPKGVSSELDSVDKSKYYFLLTHDTESDNIDLISNLSYFLKYFDYIWYQSGPQCKIVTGSYAIQNGCQHMIGN